MLQIANLEEYQATDIPKLLEKIRPILKKRQELHKRYSRNANESTLLFSTGNDNTKIPFEKFVTDLASGYLSGTPVYSVTNTSDKEKAKLINALLDKDIKDDDYKTGMEIIIDYISSYNDDSTENYNLIHDLLELTACYEILYENEDNEIVYSKYSPLQTVATWDYNIPANLTGLVRVWNEEELDGKIVEMVELTDRNGSRTYRVADKVNVTELDNVNHNWGDVPALAVEIDYSIFEPAEDVISAYEQLVQNTRNTFQYNDTDCKLKISGYSPENPIVSVDDNGKEVYNPARKIEDQRLIKAKTFFVSDGGDVSWITKQLDASGVQTILKIYVDLLFQLSGIPNTSDLAFNSADLNASAIDRKFYIMNMATASIVSELKKAYLRRWELIFGRINLKKGTNFDFRDISIELPKNLPSQNDEIIDSMLKLQGIISEQTIIEKLGFNYIDERNKKDNEAEDNMLNNIERMKMLKDGGANIQESTIREQTGKDEIKSSKTDEEIIESAEEE